MGLTSVTRRSFLLKSPAQFMDILEKSSLAPRNPFFSVIVPTYNRASSIESTLRSVKEQTLADFECIIIDDGSADYAELIRLVESLGDFRFRVERRENGGGGAARNSGIRASKGEFIAFLDSDDFFMESKLECYKAAIDATIDAGHTVFFSQVVVDRGRAGTWTKPSRGPSPQESIDEYLILRGGFIQTSTIVLAREVAARIGFDESLPFGQDTDFCIRLAAGGYNFRMLFPPLVIWRDDSVANRVSSSRKHEALLAWTDRNRESMTSRSYHAYRGWHVAKAAMSSQRGLSARLYCTALFSGAFSPTLAARVFLQLAFPPKFYRALADLVVRVAGKRLEN